MCCLPNKFPLPIFLLINKSDEVDRMDRSPWLESNQIKNYVDENQFFKSFYISSVDRDSLRIRESSLSNQSVELDHPIKEIIKTIFQFHDIKDQILKGSKSDVNSKVQLSRSNTTVKLNKSGSNDENVKSSKCYIL